MSTISHFHFIFFTVVKTRHKALVHDSIRTVSFMWLVIRNISSSMVCSEYSWRLISGTSVCSLLCCHREDKDRQDFTPIPQYQSCQHLTKDTLICAQLKICSQWNWYFSKMSYRVLWWWLMLLMLLKLLINFINSRPLIQGGLYLKQYIILVCVVSTELFHNKLPDRSHWCWMCVVFWSLRFKCPHVGTTGFSFRHSFIYIVHKWS